MASSSSSRQRPSRLEVEITIISSNLKPLNSKGEGYYTACLNTYAVTWVSTNSDAKIQTSIDRSFHTNPTWNETFVMPLRAVTVDQSTLHIRIRDHAMQDAVGDDDVIIGSVSLPLDEVGIGKQAQLKKMELMSTFGDPRGKLKFRVMIRNHQGMEDYTLKLPPPRPLPKFNPPSAPPLPTFNSPSAPPLPTFNPPSPPPPPLPTFNPPSSPVPPYENLQFGAPPASGYPYSPLLNPSLATGYPYNPHHHSYGGRCPYSQQLPYSGMQLKVMGTVFAVGVGVGLLSGVVLGMNPEMLERVLGFIVFVLTVFFGFLIMTCCTCEEY